MQRPKCHMSAAIVLRFIFPSSFFSFYFCSLNSSCLWASCSFCSRSCFGLQYRCYEGYRDLFQWSRSDPSWWYVCWLDIQLTGVIPFFSKSFSSEITGIETLVCSTISLSSIISPGRQLLLRPKLAYYIIVLIFKNMLYVSRSCL